MPVGRVLWFNAAKGYGFIRPSDSLVDVFVSADAVKGAGMAALQSGQTVGYDVVVNRGTTSAVNLRSDDP